uniref:NADH dehydrogenase subunit 6 n=1 Tax=Pseudophoraspis kabakovi TaxID=2421534 RepID=UPI0027A8D9DB|nr:NADH dehydrogenase subunit 6 [Pseudophoraspis kabakovi]WGO57519.1 NADH dehydrogenase subunit 6 [Pseudophoraspis kabakovi]
MKLLLLSMSYTMSIMFTQMNHPLAMGLMLLIQTMMVSMITGLLTQSFWFSYVLFLIFLGGMLVLFIYVTSLASNEMFSLSTKLLIMSIVIMMISMTLFSTLKFPNLMNQESFSFLMINNNSSLPLTKLYNQPTNMITIMLASYLFLTLIAVVKITNIFKGPLRQFN